MAQPKDYDPYRTPPLWIEPEAPLDYVHDADDDGTGDEDHQRNDDSLDGRPERPVSEFAKPLANSTHRRTSMKFRDYLIPPINASPEELSRWRLSLSIAVWALVVSFPVAFSAAFGYAPFPFSGFAWASSVTEIKVELLEQRIFDTRVKWCSATVEESKQFYAKQIQELTRKYRSETKTAYDLPECKELTGKKEQSTVQQQQP